MHNIALLAVSVHPEAIVEGMMTYFEPLMEGDFDNMYPIQKLVVRWVEMAEHLDHIVLFSGDGDFRRLVEAVQRRGVRVSVVSTFRSSPPMVAEELRRQADIFIELQDLAPKVARHAARTDPTPSGLGPTPARPDTGEDAGQAVVDENDEYFEESA